jgi:hypothetical protein
MSSCVVSENQPIYQALIDKSKTYINQHTYKEKAYRRAADIIRTYNSNIYAECTKVCDNYYVWAKLVYGITPKMHKFINSFILENPNSTLTSTTNILPNPYKASIEKEEIYTKDNPRRSVRNKNKVIKYFDEDLEIYQTIEDYCIKNKYVFTETLIDDFNNWYKDPVIKLLYKKTKIENILSKWLKSISSNLLKQKQIKKLNNAVKNYCVRYNICFEPRMYDAFINWYYDPNNIDMVTYKLQCNTKYQYCNCDDCSKESYIYCPYIPSYCVKKWFSTLKKSIVWV